MERGSYRAEEAAAPRPTGAAPFVQPSIPPAIRRAPSESSAPFLCPACGQKEFKRWPWGWDVHAAHACGGLTGTDPEQRKAEFRRRFAHHFH
jgi:hypothetical protein